jgi:peptide/nickel transport system substrate-binding protein
VDDDNINVLFWNHANVVFENRDVRRALRVAIDHRELFELLNLPATTPIIDAPLSKSMMRRGSFPEPIPFDPAHAGRLLDEAGWSRRNREGIRIRDGRAFTFRVIAEMEGATSTYESAVYLQAAFKKIGIQMELHAAERAAIYQRLKVGDYEAAILSLGMYQYSDAYLPAAGYNDPQYRSIIERLQSTFDPVEQEQAYAELASVFRRDVPAVALYPKVLTTVASRRLHGLDASPYPGDPTWCMDDLWLEQGA